MYKNRLQQYAQKKCLTFPVYTCEVEGPPHARRFRSKVSFDGKLFETFEFFPTMKEAERAVAKVVCQALNIDVQEEGGLYKSLLQEFAQKRGLLCPYYETNTSGPPHVPKFVSTVEVGGNTFQGVESKTKKQAEMDAARVAYYALAGSQPTGSSSVDKSESEDHLTENIQATAMIQKHALAINEEAEIHAKRGKLAHENVNVKDPLSGPSSHSNKSPPPYASSLVLTGELEHSKSPLLKRMTVVLPRKLSKSIPDCASVKPYSDDQWVAYSVELQQRPGP